MRNYIHSQSIFLYRNIYKLDLDTKIINSMTADSTSGGVFSSFLDFVIFLHHVRSIPNIQDHGTLSRHTLKSVKMDSAQSSSNKCKNYLLKIYSQRNNFLNTI